MKRLQLPCKVFMKALGHYLVCVWSAFRAAIFSLQYLLLSGSGFLSGFPSEEKNFVSSVQGLTLCTAKTHPINLCG